MRIFFARHGESEANVQRIISNRELPHRLTPTGIAQTEALAELLVNAYLVNAYDVQMIVASPIARATATATIIAARHDLPLTIDPALREIDCGMMEGRGDDAATRAWDEGDYDRRIPPDGESLNDVRARFLPFVTQLVDQHQELRGDILLIAHGSLLRYMLPLTISNIDASFVAHQPLGTCELVVTQYQDGDLRGISWAGLKID